MSPDRKARPGPTVMVIGAGIIGAAVAEELATRGADVTVLDMRGPGRGASHASAGMLAPYLEADERSPLLPLAVRSLDLFDDWIARVSRASGRAIEYARTGTLEVALDDAEAARLSAMPAWLAARGVAAEWLDSHGLRARQPQVTPSAHGALSIGTHGFVGVASLLGALVHAARLAGATFVSPVEASLVEARRDSVDVRTESHTYTADAVVIASGSWSKRVRIAGVAALPIRPIRGQLLHLTWPDDARPAGVVWGPACYTVPWTDGSLLVGATMEDVGFDESTTVEGIEGLMSAVRALLPRAAHAQLREVRVGLRPATPDGLPAIGPLARAPRVTIATGHYRNGILLAPLTAAIVAASVLDGTRDEGFEVTTPDRLLQG